MLNFIPYKTILGFTVFSYLLMLLFLDTPRPSQLMLLNRVYFHLRISGERFVTGSKRTEAPWLPKVRASWSTGCSAGFGFFLCWSEPCGGSGARVAGQVTALLDFCFVPVLLLAQGLSAPSKKAKRTVGMLLVQFLPAPSC